MPDSQGKIVGISVPVVPWHKDKLDPRPVALPASSQVPHVSPSGEIKKNFETLQAVVDANTEMGDRA